MKTTSTKFTEITEGSKVIINGVIYTLKDKNYGPFVEDEKGNKVFCWPTRNYAVITNDSN